MFRAFNLTFTKTCADFVKDEYSSAELIIEYGSGGSTILAAEFGKTIITTESSASWLIELMGAYKEKNLSGNIVPIYPDIGATKDLGYPLNESHWQNWPTYAKKAWRYCSDNNLKPDLALIDGRFRVACFIAICVNTVSPIKVLFDDYAKRPHYHLVEKILEPEKYVDDRMAVFNVKPNMVTADFLIDNIEYFYNPA